MSVASYPREYGGRDSFLKFCHDKIRFTFKEKDQISRKSFGLSYRNFCVQRRFRMASIVDFIAHLSYVGIKAKLLDDGPSTTYVFCGIAWDQRSINLQGQVALEKETFQDIAAVHGDEEVSRNVDVVTRFKNDPFLYGGRDSYITFCESIPLIPYDNSDGFTQSHMDNCHREFSRKGILVEASAEDVNNHLLSVDTNSEVKEPDTFGHFAFSVADVKSDSCPKGRNASFGVDIKCRPLRENNRRGKNKERECKACSESALQTVSKCFRSKMVDAENASKPKSRVVDKINGSRKPRKRNLKLSTSSERIAKCSSELQSSRNNMEMSKYLEMTRRPQRWVSGVLLRDIRKYPLYQIKMWLNDDGSEWVFNLPFYEGIESFRLFVIENIILTGKMQDLILCDDFLKEYREFCVGRNLLQASDANITRSLSLIGINPHVKVLKPGQPSYAYSGMAWRHKKYYEKYEKIEVKVILHDRISVC